MKNVVRALSEDGGVLAIALDSTAIVAEMERIHQPSAVVSAALGRLLTAGSLMGNLLKEDQETLTLRINGGGPAGTLLVVSDAGGNVRGYAENNIVELPKRSDGKLDVGAAVGVSGTLTVIRDSGAGEPYIGTTPLVSGEIAEDITAYYAGSEQVPTVCALGVLVNKDLSILSAGGFLLQLLPGVEDATIDTIEKNLAWMQSISAMLQDGRTPIEILNLLMAGLSPQVLDETESHYHCRCSEERTKGLLVSLGTEEIERMKQEGENAEVVCHFCNKKYSIGLDEIAALIR